MSSIPLTEYPAQKILLVKPSALGDVVQTLPVLSAVRHRYPTAHIAWVINRAFEPLLHGHPDLNETISFDRQRKGKGLLGRALGFRQFLKDLRGRDFDLVLDLQGLLRSGLIAFATGAARRVGLTSAREGAAWFYTDQVDDGGRKERHAVDFYWSVAEALGVGHLPKTFHLPIAEEAVTWANERFHDCPRPWLVVGAGSRWQTKRWPAAHFATLVKQAQSRFGGTALFIGSGDEADLARAVAQDLAGPWRDFTGRTNLSQLVALLARADVMISNDSGPLHLAAALGRPVVAPYTCTRVFRNGPYAQEARAIETNVWCKGSYVRTCRRLECMDELTPARLWPVLEEVLLTWERQRRSA